MPPNFLFDFFSDLAIFMKKNSTPVFSQTNLVVSDARLNHQISRIFEVDHTLQRNVSARTPVENPQATRSSETIKVDGGELVRKSCGFSQGYENWRDGGEHLRSMLANTRKGEVCQHDGETLLKIHRRHEHKLKLAIFDRMMMGCDGYFCRCSQHKWKTWIRTWLRGYPIATSSDITTTWHLT